jgi:RNA polymerase sigma-70 factor (ECF subfamily)
MGIICNMIPAANSGACFSATHWSLVVTAARTDEAGQQALEQLCSKYWYPVYAFLRRHGHSAHDAEDLTQGFFADLLRRDWLAGVGAEKGKFRTFLLACLENYRNKTYAREMGPTRNPGQPLISFDAQTAEQRYVLEPVEVRDPAALFERRLALTLIDDVLRRIQEDHAVQGKAIQFEALRVHLIGDAERGSYAETASKLNSTEAAARVAATRMREKFQTMIRAEITATVEDPRDVDGEIRHIIGLFSR